MRRLLTAMTAALPLALGVVAAGTSAASAAPSGCTHDWGSPSGTTHGAWTVRTLAVDLGGRTVHYDLRAGTLDGSSIQVGWGRLRDGRAGDGVTLEISPGTEDGLPYWAFCSTATAGSGGTALTHAFQTSSSAAVKFRVCGNGRCTAYW